MGYGISRPKLEAQSLLWIVTLSPGGNSKSVPVLRTRMIYFLRRKFQNLLQVICPWCSVDKICNLQCYLLSCFTQSFCGLLARRPVFGKLVRQIDSPGIQRDQPTCISGKAYRANPACHASIMLLLKTPIDDVTSNTSIIRLGLNLWLRAKMREK